MTGVSARVWFALGIVYVVWGSTYLAIRWNVETMPPFLGASIRFLVAGGLLAAHLRIRRGPAPHTERHRLGNAALAGVLTLAGGNGLVVFAETRVPSGLAALLIAAVPLWLVVLRRLAGDRTHPLTIVGVLVGLIGVATLLLPGSRGGHVDLPYCLLLLAAALSWSAGSLLAVRRPVPQDPARLSSVEMLAGGAVLLAVSGAKGEIGGFDPTAVSTRSWLALSYLIVFGSLVAFSAYLWVFANAPTSLVATYAYVNPAVAVVLGALLAGERLTLLEGLGALVILASVVVVVTAESRFRDRSPGRRRRALPRSGPRAGSQCRSSQSPSQPRSSRSP